MQRDIANGWNTYLPLLILGTDGSSRVSMDDAKKKVKELVALDMTVTSSARDRAVEIYENKILGRSTTLAALAKVNVISELDSSNAQKSVTKSNVRFTSLQCSQCSASLLNDVTGMNFCYKCGLKLKVTKSS